MEKKHPKQNHSKQQDKFNKNNGRKKKHPKQKHNK
jgi:hypothetical protein